MKIRAYEAGDGVGGTWFWNRYPGCRCDVESMEYSYSFDDDLQQEWRWPERYGTQPEILKYINHVAERFDLLHDVQLNTRITAAYFDGNSNLWTITTEHGETVSAPFCIMATGNLSTPRFPQIAGIDDYQGEKYHTGLWPNEGVDFTGKIVGAIGTGSSGVQSIPLIAKQAKHLYVFQRSTANFSLPARNAPLDPEKQRKHKEEYAERRKAAYSTPFGIAGLPSAGQMRRRGVTGREGSVLRSEMGGRRQYLLPVCLQGSIARQGRQRHSVGFRAREDPRDGRYPKDGGAFVPERSSYRHETSHSRY